MPIYTLDEKATGRLLADVILESSRSVELAQQMAAASQQKHLTGAVLATYTILDLCQVTKGTRIPLFGMDNRRLPFDIFPAAALRRIAGFRPRGPRREGRRRSCSQV
jgi:hypothetical protein